MSAEAPPQAPSQKHDRLVTLKARSYADLGDQLGERFRDDFHAALDREKANKDWSLWRGNAEHLLPFAEQEPFKSYMDEFRAYVKAVGANFLDAFTLACEDGVKSDEIQQDHCTTGTIQDENGPRYVVSVEDWDEGHENTVYPLIVEMNGVVKHELAYKHGFRGLAVTATPDGAWFTHSRRHRGEKRGVPHVLTARAISETQCVVDAMELLRIERNAGFAHMRVEPRRRLPILFECTSDDFSLSLLPGALEVDANHYRDGRLLEKQIGPDATHSVKRAAAAQTLIQPGMTPEQIKAAIMPRRPEDIKEHTVFNNRSIAVTFLHVREGILELYLKTEPDKGFVTYPLGQAA